MTSPNRGAGDVAARRRRPVGDIKRRLGILAAAAAVTVVAACGIPKGRLTDEQLSAAAEAARAKALAVEELTESERKVVRERAPRVRYTVLAGEFVRYAFGWDPPGSRCITVKGTGDTGTLDGAVVERTGRR